MKEFDFEALANEPLDLSTFEAPATLFRDEGSWYTLPNRFQSLTADFQSLEDLFDDKKNLEEGIAEDNEILEKIKQNIQAIAEHKKQLEGYLAECVDDIKYLTSKMPAVPSIMFVKDFKIVQNGEYFYETVRRVIYRVYSIFYDKEGKIVTSKLLKNDIPADQIKEIIDEYLDSGRVKLVEYFDGTRREKKTVDKWIRKYLEEEKIKEAK